MENLIKFPKLLTLSSLIVLIFVIGYSCGGWITTFKEEKNSLQRIYSFSSIEADRYLELSKLVREGSAEYEVLKKIELHLEIHKSVLEGCWEDICMNEEKKYVNDTINKINLELKKLNKLKRD